MLSCYSFMPQMQQRLPFIIIYVPVWIFIYILCDIFVFWHGNRVQTTVFILTHEKMFWESGEIAETEIVSIKEALEPPTFRFIANVLPYNGCRMMDIIIHPILTAVDSFLMAFYHIYLKCLFLPLIYFSVHIWCLFCNLQWFAYAIVIWFISCSISLYIRGYVGLCYKNACYSFLLFTSLFLHDLYPYFNHMLFFKSHALMLFGSVLFCISKQNNETQ